MPPKAPKIIVSCSECNTLFETRPLELGQSQPLVCPPGLSISAATRIFVDHSAAQQRHMVWTTLCPKCAASKTKRLVESKGKMLFDPAIAKRWSEILVD